MYVYNHPQFRGMRTVRNNKTYNNVYNSSENKHFADEHVVIGGGRMADPDCVDYYDVYVYAILHVAVFGVAIRVIKLY